MSISAVLDRIHDINAQKIGTPVDSQSTITVNSQAITVRASRYYPRELHALPTITVVPGQATYTDRFGEGGDTVEVTESSSIQIIVFVHNFMAGAGPEDAQQIAEELMEQIKLTYKARPRLELASGGPPLSVLTEKIRFRQRTDIEESNENVAVVTFTIDVQFDTTVTKVI